MNKNYKNTIEMILKNIEGLLNKMDNIINNQDNENDDDDNHFDDKLNELHGEIEYLFLKIYKDPSMDLHKVMALEKRFKKINNQWENPNYIQESTLDMMFPNDEDDGFDIDDFFGLN